MADQPGGYDESFIDLPKRLECPICLCGLRDPHLTHCGHRACHKCLRRLRKADGSITCPICQTKLTSEKVYPDNAVKREVLDLKVKCARSPQCFWTGELRTVENHNSSCQFLRLPCPLICGKSVMRRNMNEHCQGECCRRKVKCNLKHCGSDVEIQHLEKHKRECSQFPVLCPQDCSIRLPRCKIDDHIAEKCPNTVVDCLFEDAGCPYRGRRKYMDDYMDDYMEKEIVEHMTLSHEGQKRVKKELEQTKKEMEQAKKELEQTKKELESVIFTYCWKLTEWSKKAEKVQNSTKMKHFYSSPFYIQQPGNRMRLRLELSSSNGIGLFLQPVKGEYDDSIEWPWRCKYSLAVVDQSENGKDEICTITRQTLEEKFPTYFVKPDEKSLGKSSLVSFNDSSKFVKGNCVLLKVVVYRW